MATAQLCSVWQDDDFNPERPGILLHPRVLEKPELSLEPAHLRGMPGCAATIPPPFRARHGELLLPPTTSQVIQERAWSSPIWYTPAS